VELGEDGRGAGRSLIPVLCPFGSKLKNKQKAMVPKAIAFCLFSRARIYLIVVLLGKTDVTTK
jgi:hypothetical protein